MSLLLCSWFVIICHYLFDMPQIWIFCIYDIIRQRCRRKMVKTLQFHLQRLPVGRDNVSHVWRVPLWRWLRGRCQQKRVSPAGITWNPDTDEPHNPSGVVSIDGIIAYIENRDGNTPVKFHQADTLSRAFKLLHSYGLHIGIFRADCGSYSEDIGTPPLHHNQWLGQWREERYRNVQQAWGERARLRPSQQWLRMEASAMLLLEREHRVHDADSLLHEFLLVFHKSRVIRIHQLVSYVKSQEVWRLCLLI